MQTDIILYLYYELSNRKMIDKKRESKFIASNHQPPEHERELSMSARASALKEHFASRTLFNLKGTSDNTNGSDESEHGV
ncbi:hypothetical protein [Pseudoalteromonas phenolica]|nr:hypothetical protein [Pseudoalteromonas phenolica]